MPTPEQKDFVSKLQNTAKHIPHDVLAAKLRIKIWQLRNWLYQNHPNPWRLPGLESRLDAVRKAFNLK